MMERVTGVVTGPLRIAGQLAAGLVDRVVDGSGQDRWEVRPEVRREMGRDPDVDGTPAPTRTATRPREPKVRSPSRPHPGARGRI